MYYPNGNKREMRSHKEVDKGIILNYCPNGERLCDIVFNDDASINLEKTKFFNNKGKTLDIIKSKTIELDCKNKIINIRLYITLESLSLLYFFSSHYSESLAHIISMN